jgi:hypothetical protein
MVLRVPIQALGESHQSRRIGLRLSETMSLLLLTSCFPLVEETSADSVFSLLGGNQLICAVILAPRWTPRISIRKKILAGCSDEVVLDCTALSPPNPKGLSHWLTSDGHVYPRKARIERAATRAFFPGSCNVCLSIKRVIDAK